LAFVRCGFGFGFLYLMVFASFNTPFVVFNKLVLLLIKKKLLLEGVLVAGLVVDVCWC
jgi:hypothetical protein